MSRIGVGYWECTDRERELVNEVLDSGRLSYGVKSREFENRFSGLHGASFGVLSNSGTSSLQVALQALKEEHGWSSEHEVIVPAVTFVATYNIVLHNNMRPVLVDVHASTYNMDHWQLKGAITPETRAIIPVHLFGQPANMSFIRQVVHDENESREEGEKIRIIEDSCETMFATHEGRSVGSWGDIGCFSTYMAHLITSGVGGVGVTSNPVYASRMRSLVNHGRDGIYISMDDAENKEILDRRFKFVSVGHSFRITELEAAIGLAQLDTWQDMIARRRHNARYLTWLIENSVSDKIQTPYTAAGNTHSFMMYPIVMKQGNKWDMCHHLEENGIETREMLPLTNQPVYDIDQDKYPVAKWINESGFYVGCHQGLGSDDMDHIYDTLASFYE